MVWQLLHPSVIFSFISVSRTNALIKELNPNCGTLWIQREVVIFWSHGDPLPVLKTVGGIWLLGWEPGSENSKNSPSQAGVGNTKTCIVTSSQTDKICTTFCIPLSVKALCQMKWWAFGLCVVKFHQLLVIAVESYSIQHLMDVLSSWWSWAALVCLGCFDSFFNTGIPGWIFSSGLSFESGFAPALTIWVQPYQISGILWMLILLAFPRINHTGQLPVRRSLAAMRGEAGKWTMKLNNSNLGFFCCCGKSVNSCKREKISVALGCCVLHSVMWSFFNQLC